MYDTCRFWMKRGVYGFRLDAIPSLFEDAQLRDEPVVMDENGKPKINAYGDVAVDESMTNNLPQVHDVEKELREVINEFPGRMLIGETYFSNIADLRRSYGQLKNDELQLPMDFQVGMINKLDIDAFRRHIGEVETQIGGNEPLLVFDNHEQSAAGGTLRRWSPRSRYRTHAGHGLVCQPRHRALLLRRRNCHDDHAASA